MNCFVVEAVIVFAVSINKCGCCFFFMLLFAMSPAVAVVKIMLKKC